MTASRYPWFVLGMMLSLWTLAAGCGSGGKPTGRIVGQVLYKGAPVTAGEVQLQSKERGLGTTAKLDASGNFLVPALETGTYAVSVTPPPSEEAATRRPAVDSSPIPRKARDFNSSGLSITVAEGKNNITLELTD